MVQPDSQSPPLGDTQPAANEQRIIECWSLNAEPWIEAVEHGGIRSPGTLTREAILHAIADYGTSGGKVLDVGCGEGWLTDELVAKGYLAAGVDVAPQLIEHACRTRRGTFILRDQSDLASAGLGRFDLVVCNFSLFGDLSVRDFLRSLPELMTSKGFCIIQTLHPLGAFSGGDAYEDQWRSGTWAGLPGEFGEASPWFFRTLEGWVEIIRNAGLTLQETREPRIEGEAPASIIFIIRRGDGDRIED